MRPDLRPPFVFLLLLTAPLTAARADELGRAECGSLTSLALPDIRITESVEVAAAPVPHCKVIGVVGREIRFMVLMPARWNGNFLMSGSGGFAGVVDASADEMAAGYASAGTDTGHEANGGSARWALNDVERQENYGHVGMHRATVAAKAVVAAFYGKPPARSYFTGCSNGGRQALMEAERYPDDFDGIVAGAPAFNYTAIVKSFVKNVKAAAPDPHHLMPGISAGALTTVQTRVLEACDALDGLRDGVMEDPRACSFSLATIPSCPTEQAAAGCLTAHERAVFETVHRPTDSYAEQPFGDEGAGGAWDVWITGRPASPGTPSLQWIFANEFYKNLVFGDSTWDYTTYDLGRADADMRRVATFLDATNPDLSAFIARGGRLLLWHGWSDPALNALETVKFFGQIQARTAAARDGVRLFMLPGVLHCGDGSGPDQVDWTRLISDWVERGATPERVVATKLTDGKPTRTRPLCAYPSVAVYRGSGSPDVESSFACRAPTASRRSGSSR
jgi:poly(3-hydroxybutyrate) depolymerase